MGQLRYFSLLIAFASAALQRINKEDEIAQAKSH